MTYEEILYEVKDRVATITLNRPDKLNAWTARMEEEVRTAMRQADADEDVRVIVLTGAGRGFCAGADMSLLTTAASTGAPHATPGPRPGREPDQAGGLGMATRGSQANGKTYFPALSKPVIGAINGVAVGLGMVIALYCDWRVASSEARFNTVFGRRGLIAEYGIAWLLPRIVGLNHALDLLISSRMVGADEALRIGLVSRVFPQEEFLPRVMEEAREVANMISPRSMRIIKQQVWDGLSQPLEASVATAEQELFQSLACEDFKEGVQHFVEKRKPAFTGR